MTRSARPRPRTGTGSGFNRDEPIAILSSPETSSRGSSPQRSSLQRDTKSTSSVLGKRSLSRQISNDRPYSQKANNTNSRRSVDPTIKAATSSQAISTSTSDGVTSGEWYNSRYATVDESDDDDNFFNRRVARGGSRLSPYENGDYQRSHSIHVESGSSSPDEDEDGWSSDGAEPKGNKRRRGLKPSKWLEQWSEAEEEEEADQEEQVKSDPDKRRNSDDESERDELAEGSASDAEATGNAASRGATNGARSAKRRKRSVSLTPPPPLSKEAERQLQELLDRNMGPTHPDDSDDEDDGSPGNPSPKAVRRRALQSQRRGRSSTKDVADDITIDPSISNYKSTTDTAASKTKTNGRGASASVDAKSPVGDIHPDLAFYYRGTEAADLRKRAEEERRKEDRIRAARQKELEALVRKNEAARREKQQASKGTRSYGHTDSHGVCVISDSEGETPRRAAAAASIPPPKETSQQSKPATQEEDVIDIGDSSSEDERLVNSNANTNGGGAHTQEQPSQPLPDEPRIAVTLRAANGKSIEMKVKSTTLFKTMLDHFMGQLTDQEVSPAKRSSAKLTFDGETIDLDSTTADLDLEGEEMIDVQW